MGCISNLSEKDRSDKAQTKMMLETIGKFIGAQLKPLRDEITKLKAEIAELKQGGFKYAGVYQRAVGYDKGTVVTFDGSMSRAVKDTQPSPTVGQ